MIIRWIRTCQECLNEQEDVKPKDKSTDAYLNRKCKNVSHNH